MTVPGGTCPGCFEHLDELWCDYLQWQGAHVYLTKWGLEFDDDNVGDTEEEEYRCRKCFTLITEYYQEAEDFLHGEGPWILV